MQQNKKHLQKGFTLPEVIVAMAVLVMVIFSATTLVVSIIRSNAENVHTLTAYGLAQEGLEAVRNMRDSNWLLGARFNGTLGSFQTEIWGESFPEVDGYYRVNLNSLVRSPNPITNISQATQLTTHAPWSLEEISGPDDDKALLQKFTDENTGQVAYRHPEIFDTEGKETLYHRYLYLENISQPGTMDKLRVTSIVTWKERQREKEVKLLTELTDWNKGQL